MYCNTKKRGRERRKKRRVVRIEGQEKKEKKRNGIGRNEVKDQGVEGGGMKRRWEEREDRELVVMDRNRD